MKKRVVLGISILPLLLTSCGDGVGSKTFFVDRTEEVNLSFEDDTLAYSNHAYYKNWDEIKPQLDLGIGMLVVLTQTTCGHCTRFKDTFVGFCKANSIAYGVIENTGKTYETYQEYHKQVDALNEYYGYAEGDEELISAATPSVLGLNSEKAFEIVGGAVTYSRLSVEVKRFVTLTEIYHTRTFSITDEKTLKYLLDSTNNDSVEFYKNELYPEIKKSKKRVDIIDFDLLDDTNKQSVLDAYSINEYEPLLICEDGTVNVKNDLDAARSLIKGYK